MPKKIKPPVKCVVLEISSWKDFVPGATHYHGRLVRNWVDPDDKPTDRSIKIAEVGAPMTAAEACRKNKDETCRHHVPGELNFQFLSEEKLIERAKAIWLEKFPAGEILLKGSVAHCDPQQPLAARDGSLHPLFCTLLKLWRSAEALDYWEDPANEKKMKLCCAKWDKALRTR